MEEEKHKFKIFSTRQSDDEELSETIALAPYDGSHWYPQFRDEISLYGLPKSENKMEKRPHVIRGQFAVLEGETLEEAKHNHEFYEAARYQSIAFAKWIDEKGWNPMHNNKHYWSRLYPPAEEEDSSQFVRIDLLFEKFISQYKP